MTMGRPTDYLESFCDEVAIYLESTGREQTTLPSLEGFAKHIDVSVDTITDWQVKYPDFLRAIKQIKERQKQQLMDDGLYGGKEVNSSMAIFLLKANHDMIETERKQIVGADNKTLQIEFIEDTALKDANDQTGD